MAQRKTQRCNAIVPYATNKAITNLHAPINSHQSSHLVNDNHEKTKRASNARVLPPTTIPEQAPLEKLPNTILYQFELSYIYMFVPVPDMLRHHRVCKHFASMLIFTILKSKTSWTRCQCGTPCCFANKCCNYQAPLRNANKYTSKHV